MNEPKRWSEAGSEVDPVVRSLVRHAQGRAPSDLDVERLVATVERRSTQGPAILRQRAVRTVAWLAVATTAGVVGAFVGPKLGFRASQEAAAPALKAGAASTAVRATPGPAREPTEDAPVLRARETAKSPGAEPVAPVSRALEPRRRHASPPPASSAASRPDVAADVLSLTQARRVLGTDPARALALTEASASEAPASPVAEERAAIAVEALVRLGRTEQARQRLERFEQSFPSSPYRRRLNALLSAQGGVE